MYRTAPATAFRDTLRGAANHFARHLRGRATFSKGRRQGFEHLGTSILDDIGMAREATVTGDRYFAIRRG